jgi:RNA polymerase sigma factor (sigma-70 family)
MGEPHLHAVLQHVRKLAAGPAANPPSDRDLLDRFVAHRDEAAFAALLERHGAMVLGICRRVLRHAHDAEDAWQAAFLVLARKAASIRRKDALGAWLHGVAYHVATNLRRDLARRGAHEVPLREVGQADAAGDVTWREIRAVLDEELARLPERLRAPLVLCYLEGRTRDEAARQLGWGLGTFRGRLERGRKILSARLRRRGLALSAALVAAALSEHAAAAGVSPALMASIVHAATSVGAGGEAAQVASAQVAELVTGALRAMSTARFKVVALVLLVAGGITACAGAIAYHALAVRQPGPSGLDSAQVAGDGRPDAESDQPSRRGSPPQVGPNAQLTEVAVVATQHFLTDMPEGFTPAHLRLLLTRLSPDLLAVEAPTNVVRPWDFAPLELARVTRPWADGRRIPVVPAGWYEPGYQAQLAEMLDDIRARGRWDAYQHAEQSFQSQNTLLPTTCQSLNSREGHALWRDYHAALHALYGKDTPWELWQAKILANVLRVCRANPGRRVVVVLGAAHGYFVLDGLAREKEVRLVRVEKFLPLDPEAVAAETTPSDHLQALRLLNFPTVEVAQLDKLEAHLARIKDVPGFRGDYHLFRGKFLLHRGQPADALGEFRSVARLDRQSLSAFDGQTRLQEAGQVYAAIARQRTGDTAGARSDLEAFLDEPDVTPSSKRWAADVLAGIPKPN